MGRSPENISSRWNQARNKIKTNSRSRRFRLGVFAFSAFELAGATGIVAVRMPNVAKPPTASARPFPTESAPANAPPITLFTPTETPMAESAPADNQSPTPAESQVASGTRRSWKGKVSQYSRDGCLGCNAERIMGNGEPLDDNAFTIGVPCDWILDNSVEYNTRVRVTNLDTGASLDARITDCGNLTPLNRVADITPAATQALSTETDITNVGFEVV